MSTTDWYRQEVWTSEVSDEFESRLARSRGQRSEYLRIQAITLADSLKQDCANAAIGLARRFLDLKKAGHGVAQMHATIAKAFSTLGDTASAAAAYRAAVDAEILQPNVRGYCYIDFAWFAASRRLSALYDDVLATISRNKVDQDLIFPANQYRYFGALALISFDLGDDENARRMAKNALSAATCKSGLFDQHPALGLVSRRNDDEAHGRIEQIAGQPDVPATFQRTAWPPLN